MKSRAAIAEGLLHSTGAATLAQVVRILAIFATHLVLRRMVPRADWGLWNWAEPVFIALAAVRDLGVPSHVVRRRPLPLGNLLAVEGVWGGALAGLIALAAPWIAQLFATPRPDVALVIRVLAISLFIEGIASVPTTYFEAELAIRRALGAELARTATYCGTALLLGWLEYGVWTFVGAQVASQVVYFVWLWIRARGTIRLHWARGETAELVITSLPLGGVWLLGYATSYADAFILGWLFTDTDLGGYWLAYVNAYLVARSLQPPIGRSLYPAFVAFRDRPEEHFRAYRLGTILLLAIEVPAALFLAVNAGLAVRVLGGAQYVDSAGLLVWLAFVPLVDPLGRFGGEYLIAIHRERERVLSILANLVVLVVAGFLLARRFGPIGMAWANFLPAGALVVVWTLARVSRSGLRKLFVDLAWTYAIPVPLFAVAWFAGREHAGWRLGLSIAAGLAALGLFWRRFGGEFRDFFARASAVEAVAVPPPIAPQ